MKVKRNTAPATISASKSKQERRDAKKQQIINEMCPEYCNQPENGGWCREGAPPCGAVLVGCLSLKSVAEHLTTWGITTLQGKKNWQASQVGNVFKEELKQLQQSKTDEPPNSSPDSQTGITW